MVWIKIIAGSDWQFLDERTRGLEASLALISAAAEHDRSEVRETQEQ